MKKNKYLLLMLIFFGIVTACSDMSDKHDLYLQDGEIIYIGRVDSAKILPGNRRFLLRYWITDNRAKELHIYWNQRRDSLTLPIPVHQPSDSIEALIGDQEMSIPEGNYTFQLVSSDETGLQSIVFEKLGNVYGERFASTLTDRFIQNVNYDPDGQTVTVRWGDPSSSQEIGVEIAYFEGDTEKVVRLSNEEIGSVTVIENVNVEKGVTYRTMFLPEPAAIDTFFTDAQQILQIDVDETQWENAADAVQKMKVGWNLGNTLDSFGNWIPPGSNPSVYETAWGNPVTTRAMIARFREAGFNAIRVPVTWHPHMDGENNVDEAWMQRVEEVVGYVLDEGMYCILNLHHEEWLNRADWSSNSNIRARYRKLWEQIAIRFNKYDKHLIFESCNEVYADGNSAYNALLQDFVDVVRGTGGNNRYRNLCLTTYAAGHSPDNLQNFILPDDVVENRLIAEVHVYAPVDFALDPNSPVDTFTSWGEQEIRNIMSRLNQRFVSNGIPVIIGEFGSADKDNMPERVKHAAFNVSEAARYGIVCFHWMGLLNRRTLEWAEPELMEAIVSNAAE